MSGRLTPDTDGGVDLTRALYVALGRLVRSLRREQGEQPLSLGLVSALRQVAEKGPLRASALAEAEGLSGASMTRVMNALEQRGMLRRTPDPTDGRAQLVDLTEEGRRLLAEGTEVRLAALRRRLDALPEGDRRVLEAALPVLARLAEPVEQGRPGEA